MMLSLTSWLLITLSLTQTAKADDCRSLISACRVAISRHVQQENDATLALNQQIALTAQVQQQRDSATASLGAWYHNPFFMSALGFAVGAVVYGYATKR